VVGYSRLFALEGLRDGNYVPNNGAALAQIDDICPASVEIGLLNQPKCVG